MCYFGPAFNVDDDNNRLSFLTPAGMDSPIGDHNSMERYNLMQYTGLKDKNGREIYEGDIVRIGDELVEEVKWIAEGDWLADKQPMVGFVSHGTIYKGSPVEVIGNIYENPELLNDYHV